MIGIIQNTNEPVAYDCLAVCFVRSNLNKHQLFIQLRCI